MKNSRRNKTYNLISVGGLYSTGSSALIDLFLGYESLHVINSEFHLLKEGFVDLLESMTTGEGFSEKAFSSLANERIRYGKAPNIYTKMYMLLRRYPQTKNFLQDNYHRAYGNIFSNYEESTTRLFADLYKLNLKAREGIKIKEEDLNIVLESYLNSLLSEISCEGKIPVFDQLVKSNHPVVSKVMPDARIILVLRDPRDHFCDIVNRRKYKLRAAGSQRAKVFIDEYKDRYKEVQKFFDSASDNVKKVQFEDLIYKYKETKNDLEKYLNLDKNDFFPLRAKFNPVAAVSKTRMFFEYEKKEEIKLIEKHLAEWFYEFPES